MALANFTPGFGPGFNGQVNQNELDQYDLVSIDNPAVSFGWFGTVTTATTGAFVKVNQLADWPRNICYSVTGVAGGMGGTFTVNGIDQFGQGFRESVTIGSAAGGGTTYGTQICAKFLTGTYSSNGLGGTGLGTAAIGLGTASGATGNYFGLLSKLGGTADVKMITWVNSTTATTLNGGTAIGTLVNTNSHSFQGTSGVAATDHYKVVFKPTFDNGVQGTMSGL